jgi:hypothetical protein
MTVGVGVGRAALGAMARLVMMPVLALLLPFQVQASFMLPVVVVARGVVVAMGVVLVVRGPVLVLPARQTQVVAGVVAGVAVALVALAALAS